MANVPTVAHNEATPTAGSNLSSGDDRIREFKTQMREIFGVDHKMDSSGQGSTWGYHESIHLIEAADLGTGAVGATLLGSQTVGDKGELVYVDEDDNDVQLTSGGNLYITAAAIAAIGVDVDFGAYEVRAQTFESDVATGTAPLVVASTTKVTNLNADLLDGYNTTTTAVASLVPVLDASGFVTPFLESYDSGWNNAIGTAADVTLTHNLGTTKVMYQVWIAVNNDGSGGNAELPVHYYTNVYYGCQVISVSTTQIVIARIHGAVHYRIAGGTSYGAIASGYVRVLMIALE